MTHLLIVLGVVSLSIAATGFNTRNRVKRQREIDVLYEHLCIDENGERDFYCLIFCPYLHDLFVYSQRETIACAFGMKLDIDCSKETNVCSDWCAHFYDQMNMYYLHQRPREWDICAKGERPTGCDDDPNCIRWCGMVRGSYQNSSAAIHSCMKTGHPVAGCDDVEFCQDVCGTAERQRANTDEIVLKCGFTGTAPWP